MEKDIKQHLVLIRSRLIEQKKGWFKKELSKTVFRVHKAMNVPAKHRSNRHVFRQLNILYFGIGYRHEY